MTSALARPRPVGSVVKPLRLPVWPVVNGLALTALDLLGQQGLATDLEVKLGGRVAPMSLDAADADPTVTMTMHGGLLHRDSIGVKQKYGDGQVQWLTAGKGMLHEEMWWSDQSGRAELFQLWLNLPARSKMLPPKIQLFSPPLAEVTTAAAAFTAPAAAAPKTVSVDAVAGGARPVRVHVMGGEHEGVSAGVELAGGPVTLLRVELPVGSVWECDLPAGHNCVIYTRLGAVKAGAVSEMTDVTAHHLAYLPARLASGSDGLRLENAAGIEADVLVLAGQPLREPMAGGGTWVMNSQAELAQADRDYAAGQFGIPWRHTDSDEEWQAHVQKTSPPSLMRRE
eukprot:CAMPEP_0180050250 /NCGR_PEP_ID=MMETSP0985-20121206/483_1 /TAXON_ID=483367 /ORGANISM="non described non described, Strain CCMP 2436" /LENGTH=340 /DNA_ID=CAMNT_0021979343 /DNA_START=85 /DNA_END=1107 /DNA_ORIENTATION=+